MAKTRKRLGDLLTSRGLITHDQLTEALTRQREHKGRLGLILLELGHVLERDLLEALAVLHETRVWDLEEFPPAPEAIELVPKDLIAKFNVIPVAADDDELFLAMNDVDDVEAIDLVSVETRRRVVPVLASSAQIKSKSIEICGMADAMGTFVNAAMEIVGESHFDDDDQNVITERDTAPVLNLVNQLIADAISCQASDLHLEPGRSKFEVRARLDGHLHTIREFPSNILPMVVARIKIMAELDIAEHRRPQDGRFSVRIGDKSIDVRISVLPAHFGERIVLRILDGSVARRTLDQLGLTPSNRALLEELISRPYGMLLVTGPTGSGKTTTLYASLNTLKDPTKNVMTCEDPIEYEIEGIAQSQVNEKAGLSFPGQLRSILRQDPDVVLVGEIRDKETAETAIRASMTGHMVLSTLHSNNAVSAIPRLYDIGTEPYLLSTSLIGVTAQRLVRMLCPDCKREDDPNLYELAAWRRDFGSAPLDRVYRATGCPACQNIGYRGRLGVHEILPITMEIGSKIANRSPIDELVTLSRQSGFRTIQADALTRVASGETSFEEVRRVVAFESYDQVPLKAAA